jgi:hypothetical protein
MNGSGQAKAQIKAFASISITLTQDAKNFQSANVIQYLTFQADHL